MLEKRCPSWSTKLWNSTLKLRSHWSYLARKTHKLTTQVDIQRDNIYRVQHSGSANLRYGSPYNVDVSGHQKYGDFSYGFPTVTAGFPTAINSAGCINIVMQINPRIQSIVPCTFSRNMNVYSQFLSYSDEIEAKYHIVVGGKCKGMCDVYWRGRWKCRTGKCRTGIKRTKSQDWKMQDWN